MRILPKSRSCYDKLMPIVQYQRRYIDFPIKFFACILFILAFSSSSFASTYCNAPPLALATSDSTLAGLEKLPLDTIVRIASPLKDPESTPNSPFYVHGSGVLIRVRGRQGIILSANHVTGGREIVMVQITDRLNKPRILWAHRIKDNPDLDLSVYQLILRDDIGRGADIFRSPPENYKNNLFVTGFPTFETALYQAELFPDSAIRIRQEKVLGVKQDPGLGLTINPLISSDCIDAGLSGGPAFNDQGEVIGINHATDQASRHEDGSMNGYLIPADVILNFLKE